MSAYIGVTTPNNTAENDGNNVLYFNLLTDLPAVGEEGKLYFVTDSDGDGTNRTYVWSTTSNAYEEVEQVIKPVYKKVPEVTIVAYALTLPTDPVGSIVETNGGGTWYLKTGGLASNFFDWYELEPPFGSHALTVIIPDPAVADLATYLLTDRSQEPPGATYKFDDGNIYQLRWLGNGNNLADWVLLAPKSAVYQTSALGSIILYANTNPGDVPGTIVQMAQGDTWVLKTGGDASVFTDWIQIQESSVFPVILFPATDLVDFLLTDRSAELAGATYKFGDGNIYQLRYGGTGNTSADWVLIEGAGTGWEITGNAGTTASPYRDSGAQLNNFAGTTDNVSYKTFANAGSNSDKSSTELIPNVAVTQADGTVADVWRLYRNGAGAVTFAQTFGISMGRYANQANVSALTRADFKLTNGNFHVPDVTIMTLLGSGNVGVNTTNPIGSFHSTNNPTGAGAVYAGSATGLAGIFEHMRGATQDPTRVVIANNGGVVGGSANLEFWGNARGGGQSHQTSISTIFTQGTVAPQGSGTLVFSTANDSVTPTEKMRLTPEGNLGIGTATPNAPLQFASTATNRKIVLFEAANNDHQYFGFGINTDVLRSQVNVTTSRYEWHAGTSATTSNLLMSLMGTGRLGIGVANPVATVHTQSFAAGHFLVSALPQTLDKTHHFVQLNTALNGVLNIPTAVGNAGLKYHIYFNDAVLTASTVTLTSAGGGIGNPVTGAQLTTLNMSPTGLKMIEIVSDGVNWHTVAYSAGGATTPTVNAQTGTTYTTVAGDSGGTLTLTNAGAITVTLSALTAGSTTQFIQLGAGAVTFNTGTLTRRNVANLFTSAGQYSNISVTVVGTDAILSGDLS